MKTNLIILLATLVLAAVLGPMAIDALQKQSTHAAPTAELPNTSAASAADTSSANPVTTQATILNPDGTVASSPNQDRQAGGDKSGSDDDEDDDKDD